MGLQKNKEVVNAATSSEPPPPGKKARKLKAGAKIKKKSSKAKVAGSEKINKEESSKINKEESSKINKEENNKINTEESNQVKDIGVKVGGITQGNGLREANSKETKAIKETVAGLIFMCNSRTKPDCFKYKVMGLPENRRDFVFSIKPGMWLFLYDFEMKLLYGIFKASSFGGMKLEPAAFNGFYPAQVRFEVEIARAPLHYHLFKNAIKDNFTGIRNMFDIELSIEQVKELTKLFPHLPQQQQQQIITNPNVLMPQPPPAPAPVQVPAFALASAQVPALSLGPVAISRPANLPMQAPIHPLPFENFSRNHPALMQREIAQPPFGVMLHNAPKQNPYPAQPAAHGKLPGFFTHPSYSQPWPESLAPQPAPNAMLPYDMPRTSNFIERPPPGKPWPGALHVARAADPPNTFNVRNERRFVNSSYQEPPPVSSRYAFAGPTILHHRGHP